MKIEADPSFLDRLFAAGILIPSGVDGVYGRGQVFADIGEQIQALLTRITLDDPTEVFRFPPGMAEAEYKRTGHYSNFPHLAGIVHSFCGDERAHRRALQCMAVDADWTEGQSPAGIVLTPAACYPVYGIFAGRGPLPTAGYLADVCSWCFRHEPSREPTRLQMFQMREFVRVGSKQQVLDFRAQWIDRVSAVFQELALPCEVDVANDPFFGRAGQILSDSQRSLQLKFELLVPVNEGKPPTACVSFNYHMDHFGQVWDLRGRDGELAQTACIGFGLERITLALLRHHGLDPAAWPPMPRRALWPDARQPAMALA